MAELENKDSQKHLIKEQYRKWKEGDDKKKHLSTYYSGMDRLTNFKQNYSKRSGDIPMSKNFQRAYGIIVPIIFLAILGIILYIFIGLPVNGLYHSIWCDTDCTDLPVSPGIIVVAFLDSLLLLLMLINMFREPWKSQILVKTKNGSYDFRFRKGTKMESYKNKILTNLFLKADTNKDGSLDFTEFLRIGGEDHLTDEEIKEYEEDFEKADKDGDGKLSLEEMKDFSDI
ncbi:MAG: hypothetical protein CXT75_04440 [Methanobacteriota archaeon]|jgi:hypothetical protein|nr:MAG: hypothetical protein CXT75_04440 [Euryarchaeota archaeon]